MIGQECEHVEGVQVLAWWESMAAAVRRLVMLHGRSLAVWVLAIVGCTYISAIRSVFLLLAVITLLLLKWGARCQADTLSWTATGTLLPRFRNKPSLVFDSWTCHISITCGRLHFVALLSGIPLRLFSWLFTVNHYVSRSNVFLPQAAVLAQLIFFFPKFDDASGDNSKWFGFDRSYEEGQIGAVTGGFSAMLAILIARYGQSWLAQWYTLASLSHSGTVLLLGSAPLRLHELNAWLLPQRVGRTCQN